MFSEFLVRAQQWRDFASAHSCGLRLDVDAACVGRQSLPQRIRAGCDEGSYGNGKSLSSLPQRIRAGCDRRHCEGTRLSGQLCHSAFVRVATSTTFSPSSPSPFATAHSRGLRP